MSRIHAPELEDEPWFPRSLRDSLTAFLHASAEVLGTFKDAAPIVQGALARNHAHRVVDLCSGGGGPVSSLLDEIDGVDAVLTDLYPNAPAFAALEQRFGGRLRGERASVDATDVPAALDDQGVRTIFNAFHHFRPALAGKILEDAARKKRPLVILEVVERDPLTLLTIAFVPLAVLALIPFTRPNLARLFFTYLVPIIPLATGWDGMCSCLRGYSLDELNALCAALPDDVKQGYTFTAGRTRRRSFPPLRITWLVGEPAR